MRLFGHPTFVLWCKDNHRDYLFFTRPLKQEFERPVWRISIVVQTVQGMSEEQLVPELLPDPSDLRSNSPRCS
jgi:hypothetical protein